MKQNWLKLMVLISATLLCLGVTLFLVNLGHLYYRPLIQDSRELVVVEVEKAMSALSFVNMLKAQHLIDSKRVFLLIIRLQGYTHQLKAGVYQVKAGESAEQFLHRVIQGDVMKQSFTIVEGTNQAQISHRLEHAPYLEYQPSDWFFIIKAYNRAASKGIVAQEFPEEIACSDQEYTIAVQSDSSTPLTKRCSTVVKLREPSNSAEGLLLADTYYYDAGSQGKAILELAHAKLQQYLDQCWQERQSELPYKNPYELLIVASILEKESADPKERRLISGIIVNRLRKNMLLQMDPTVIYALGSQYQGKLTKSNLLIDSPFNTYRHRGLPPTPISMVGRDAIDAAAHPIMTSYLYFVATENGTHQFSVDYEQQKKAVERLRNNVSEHQSE